MKFSFDMSLRSNFQIENLGQKSLPKDAVDSLIKEGYFKLFIPKALGGLELNLIEACELLKETAFINPSLGWVHNLGAGANYFCGFFDKPTATEIFKPHNVITCGSGRPTGTYKETSRSFILNGSWDKCSGANFATYLTCVAVSEINPKELKTFILPSKEIPLTDDWNTFGLKASSSYSFALKQQSIPKNFEFEINTIKSFHTYPIYDVPFELFARICLSATFEGIALRFIEDLSNEIRNPNETFKNSLSELHSAVEINNGTRIEVAKLIFQSKKYTQTKDCTLKMNNLSQTHWDIFRMATTLFYHAGVRITEENSPANWTFRDLCTAIQHYMLK